MADQPSYRLKIGKTPIYPYCNDPFEVSVFLVDHKGHLKCGLEVALEVKLHYEDNTDRILDEFFEVGNCADQLVIKNDGKKNITVKIKALSMNHDGRKFIISVSGSAKTGEHISPAFTQAMQSIQYRLEITNKEKIPSKWYKDEGGKENWIILTARLINSNRNLVDIGLLVKLVLLYESGSEVLTKDILRIDNEGHTDHLYIDENGQVSIKFRIEEVSRGHQSQRFKVQVSPDTSEHPLWNDISSDVSNLIEVRSKKNKKNQNSRLDSPTKHPRILLGNDISAEIPDHLSVISTASECSNTAVRTSGNDFEEGIVRMIRWKDVVMDGLKSIQWKHVGYEVEANGSFDKSKPLYLMQNPLPIITKITEEYHNQSLDKYLQLFTSDPERQKSRQSTTNQASESTSHHNRHLYPSNSGELEVKRSQSTDDSILHINSGNTSVYMNDQNYCSSSNPVRNSYTSASVCDGNITTVSDSDNNFTTIDYLQHLPPNQVHVDQRESPQYFSGVEDNFVIDESHIELRRDFSGNVIPLLEENLVHFVHSTQTRMGFPVYDINRQLIGFYRADPHNVESVLNFYSIKEELISTQEIISLTNMLKRDLNNNINAIFDLDNFEQDLEQMKEQVLLEFKK